jgi:phosphate-selective porin OprO/OprP
VSAARIANLVIAILILTPAAASQEPGERPPPEAKEPNAGAVSVRYGEHGLEVRSRDGRYRAWFTLRAQLRLSHPFDEDPLEVADFDAPDQTAFAINRARFKWGGHAYREWIDYYLEYEIRDGTLLDLRFNFEKWEALQLLVGQWKPEYNRERRDSSGEQQLAERSIANRPFNLDRQPGVLIHGRLLPGTRADSHYWLGVLTGEGLGGFETEGQPMWMGRWQWNFTGRELEFSQCDLERKAEPHGSLAVAAARNRSRFTRFSSDGGGELEGFPSDVAERYDVEQGLLEGAYQHRGLSLQAEAHRKEITDRVAGSASRLEGGYAQAGYFFSEIWEAFPEPLELAARAAIVDAEEAPSGDNQRELTAGANWFFHGHRNKLTLDISELRLEAPAGRRSDTRARLQWDVSF